MYTTHSCPISLM